jgi:hypothetical protein
MTISSSRINQEYIPGVCNIGAAERTKRRQSGVAGAIVTLVLLVILVAIGAPKVWRLLLILPAFAAASGFLQDAFHFCAGFGLKGLYNVTSSTGLTNDVASVEFRRKDRHKALTILTLSFAVGAVIAGLSSFL